MGFKMTRDELMGIPAQVTEGDEIPGTVRGESYAFAEAFKSIQDQADTRKETE